MEDKIQKVLLKLLFKNGASPNFISWTAVHDEAVRQAVLDIMELMDEQVLEWMDDSNG